MASSIYNEFISQKNKGLMWDFMYKNKLFDNIPPANVNSVKQEFDSQAAFMSTQINSNDNLVDLNKRMIASMVQQLNKYRQSSSAPTIQIQSSQQPPQAQQLQTPLQKQPRPFVTAEDISHERQSLFNKALETKQEEFNNYNKKPVPSTVDFSDGSQDKPIGSEMDKMLQDAINWRQKQLNVVYDKQEQTSALNWINKDNETPVVQPPLQKQPMPSQNNINNQNNNPRILKIGQDTNLDNNQVINIKENQKKVNFSDSIQNIDSNNNDFLSLLKKKQEPDNEVINNVNDELIKMLKEILANQSKILDLLNNKNV